MIRVNKKHSLALILALTLCSGAVSAQQREAPGSQGRLVEEMVTSAALKGNLLGDPDQQRVAVYLPPSYAGTPGRRYPTLYLLHGFFGPIEIWTRNGYQGMSLQPMMDQLIHTGVSRETIVVVPNGRNAYFGSFYTNSTTIGGWEDFIVRDLVAYVDAKYRTLARPESRGIAGHSMGGYGSVILAMKHPDVFGAMYALSPCCLGLEGDLGSENPAWVSTLRIRSRDELQPRPRSAQDFFNAAFVALSAAFSPGRENPPLFVEFPFEEREGRLVARDQVIRQWKSKMPLYLVDDLKANLQKLRGIYLDFGDQEQFSHIRITTRRFSTALSERNIAHGFEIYAGGDHENKIRQRMETRVLRFFSEVLSFQ